MLDLWKGGNHKDFLGVVVAFITEDWQYHTVAVGLEEVEDSHTSDHIYRITKRILNECGITPLCYVADNASNQVKANDLLADWSNDFRGKSLSQQFLLDAIDMGRCHRSGISDFPGRLA